VKKLIINVVAGLVLFAGSLAGALAATGRLDHEGTKNIPLISALFPAPPEPKDKDGKDAAKEIAAVSPPADPKQSVQGPEAVPVLKHGRSLFAKDDKPEGHGGESKDAGHGDKPEADKAAKVETPPQPAPQPTADAGKQEQTSRRREVSYTPGSYFKFDGMPAGMTPEQLNEACQRVQQQLAELDKRKAALDQREQEMQTLEQDMGRRQSDLGGERTRLQNLQRLLEDRIEQFHQQVKMIRIDELAGLKKNAQTLASFEASKAAELVKDQWRTEAGQDLILKTLEVMDKDAANAILAALADNAQIREILERRLRIAREPAAGPGK